MNPSTYMKLTGTIFLIIALVHLLRAILGWPVMVGSMMVPVWASWVAFLVAGYLSYQGLSKK